MTQSNFSAQGVDRETRSIHSILFAIRMFLSGWYGLALCVVVLLAFFLDFFRLGERGYSNLYYAAAVKSILLNWHNFFFVSFDPGGFIAID